MSSEEIEKKRDALMDELHISHLRNNPAVSLSGGERRRVEIARALSLPDVKERLQVLGFVPFTTARPAEFAQYLRAEIAKYAKLVKAVGITPE